VVFVSLVARTPVSDLPSLSPDLSPIRVDGGVTRSGYRLWRARCPEGFFDYESATRLVVWSDRKYGLYYFDPVADEHGGPLRGDPLLLEHWRPMSLDEAVARSYVWIRAQTRHRAERIPNPQLVQLFEHLSGFSWQPYFAYVPCTTFMEVLKVARRKPDARLNVEVLSDITGLKIPPGSEVTAEQFLRGDIPRGVETREKRRDLNVRSTETKDERGNPITGVEAGPVATRTLASVLAGQIHWRRNSALDIRDLLPTSGPPGTICVGPLDVPHVLKMSKYAVDAAANEFRVDHRFVTTRAVALVIKTSPMPYEHDYPICPRFHLKSLDNVAAVPLSLGEMGSSGAQEAWFWFSSFQDNRSSSVVIVYRLQTGLGSFGGVGVS